MLNNLNSVLLRDDFLKHIYVRIQVHLRLVLLKLLYSVILHATGVILFMLQADSYAILKFTGQITSFSIQKKRTSDKLKPYRKVPELAFDKTNQTHTGKFLNLILTVSG